MSFIGNALGEPGAMAGWTYESTGADDAIWALYLAGRPAFFGTSTWPWVDPTTGGSDHT